MENRTVVQSGVFVRTGCCYVVCVCVTCPVWRLCMSCPHCRGRWFGRFVMSFLVSLMFQEKACCNVVIADFSMEHIG